MASPLENAANQTVFPSSMRSDLPCRRSPRLQSWSRGGSVTVFVIASTTASAEFTVSGYFGNTWTRSSDLGVSQPATDSDATFRNVHWDSRSFDSPPYYGVRLTYYFELSPAWGVAIDLTHYKVYARTGDAVEVQGFWNGAPVNETAPLSDRVQSFSISHGVNYIGPLILYRFSLLESPSFKHGRLQPYVGAGPVYYVDHPENTVNGLTSERYQPSGWGWQAVAGLRYLFTENWSAFGEFKYDQGKANVSVAGDGSANTRLRTSHAIFGIGYSF